MKFRSILAAASVPVVLATTPALAQQLAYTAEQLTLRAGPSIEYPVVLVLPAALQVQVLGCVTDYTWCDVAAGSARGWAYAGNLTYYHQNQHVPLNTIAAVAGIGLAAFVINDYWHDHYRDRSWYHDRYRWHQRPHHSKPPPRRHEHQADRTPHGQKPAPLRKDPNEPQPRQIRNDPNSGWDARNPNAPRADKP